MFASVVVAVSYALNQQNISWVNLFLAQSFLVFQQNVATTPHLSPIQTASSALICSVKTQEDSISHFWICYKIGSLKNISKIHIWQFILKSDISGNQCIFELNLTFKVAQTPYFIF